MAVDTKPEGMAMAVAVLKLPGSTVQTSMLNRVSSRRRLLEKAFIADLDRQ